MEPECHGRTLRMRYGITLMDLAKAAGVSVQLIGKIEFEPERWTAHNEAMLRSAFRHVISQQRGRLDQLEAALLAEGPLLRPEEVRKCEE